MTISEPKVAVRTTSEVVIVGRVGASIAERTLPSGDVITTFTLVVDRPRRRGLTASAVTVDALPCQAASARLRRQLARLSPGDVVEAHGSLRRRFWRSPAGLGSALEVDVSRVRVVR